MLHRKPSARPSAAHLSMHPYFSLITCGISHRYLRHLEASMNKLHDQRKKSPKGLVLIEVDSSTSTSSNNVSAASPIVSSLITSVANLGLEDLLKVPVKIETFFLFIFLFFRKSFMSPPTKSRGARVPTFPARQTSCARFGTKLSMKASTLVTFYLWISHF